MAYKQPSLDELKDRPMPKPYLKSMAESNPDNKLLQFLSMFVPESTEEGLMGVGSLSQKGMSKLDDLFEWLMRESKENLKPIKDEISGLLNANFKPHINLPYESLTVPNKFMRDTLLQPTRDFINSINSMPEGLLNKADVVALDPDAAAGFNEGVFRGVSDGSIGRSVRVSPFSDRIESVVPHELTHALFDSSNPKQSQAVMNYLSNLGWDIEKQFGKMPDYGALSNKYYNSTAKWPTKPSIESPKSWGNYAMSHPVEDLAESGAYGVLGRIPQYVNKYASQIDDLYNSPRRKIVDLMQDAFGVDLGGW